MNALPSSVSVTRPLTLAIERTQALLFRPFDLNVWLVMGFGAWLSGLGRSGSPGTFFRFDARHHQANLAGAIAQARDYIMNNLGWLVPLVIGVGVLAFLIGLLLNWLSSRGQFMLLHSVATGKAEVAEPWNRYGAQANSLFLFRILLSLAGVVLILPLVVIGAFSASALSQGNLPGGALILRLVLIGSGVATIAFVLLIVRKLLLDFVVPIMALRRCGVMEGWRQGLGLAGEYAGNLLLYLLFSIVLAIGTEFLVLAAVLVTCCIAGCLMALPYIGAVVLLPITLFWRSYSLYFLAQIGPEYDVFSSEATCR